MSRNTEDEMREYALRIMEALSGVDEELLERCGGTEAPEGKQESRRPHRRSPWQSLGALAAALLFVAVGVAGWQGHLLFDRAGSDGLSGGSMVQDSGTEYVRMDSTEPRSGEVNGSAEGTPENGAAGGCDTEGEVPEADQAYGYEGSHETGAAPNSVQNPMVDEYKGIDGEQEKDGAVREEAKEQDAVPPSETEKFLALNGHSYTEQEARELEGLGSYVPDSLPEGYEFHRAYADPELEGENLTICWSRGTDYIVLQLKRTEEALETVETEKPETYDQRRYDVPYEETVPEEYRQTFLDPLFAREDLAPEIIESRMTASEGGGDADAPGGFRVLYPEGVVVSFRGYGTAEEIWEMFCSMGE